MNLEKVIGLVSVCVMLASGARLPTSRVSLNSEDMAARLRYTVNDLESQSSNVNRLTAILPGTPFIKHLSTTRTNDDTKVENTLRLRQGDSVELRCEMIGMPVSIAYWTRNNRPVTDNVLPPTNNVAELIANDGRPTLETAISVAKLSLNCVTSRDAGVYQCVGDNGAGNEKAEINIVVEENTEPNLSECQLTRAEQSAPKITMFTDMRMEYSGNDAQLNCRAEGQPTPTITWRDVDDNMIQDGKNFTLLPNGDLLIKRANFGTDRPYRSFTCRATNSLGSDTALVGLLTMKTSDKK